MTCCPDVKMRNRNPYNSITNNLKTNSLSTNNLNTNNLNANNVNADNLNANNLGTNNWNANNLKTNNLSSICRLKDIKYFLDNENAGISFVNVSFRLGLDDGNYQSLIIIPRDV